MDDAANVLGKHLHKLREKAGLTLRQVEEKANVSNAFLSQVERGQRGIPTFKVLTRLADAYGVSVAYLMKVAEATSNGTQGQDDEETRVAVRLLQKLTKEQRKMFVGWIREYVSAQSDKKG